MSEPLTSLVLPSVGEPAGPITWPPCSKKLPMALVTWLCATAHAKAPAAQAATKPCAHREVRMRRHKFKFESAISQVLRR